MKENMKRYSLFLTKKQVAALTKIAAGTGIAFGEVVRRAVDEFIGK